MIERQINYFKEHAINIHKKYLKTKKKKDLNAFCIKWRVSRLINEYRF